MRKLSLGDWVRCVRAEPGLTVGGFYQIDSVEGGRVRLFAHP